MSLSIFRITDGTAAGTVDFIGGPLYIVNWSPVVPPYKNGGQYIDPPISHGRRIAFYTRENAIERVDFAQRADSGDSGDQQLARLVRLLDRAANYWTTNGREPPIWVEMRNPKQSSIRYAKIVSGRLTGFANQFAMPYLQDDGCVIVEPNLTFLMERRNFSSTAPGTTASLLLSDNSRTTNMVFDHSFEKPYGASPEWQNRNSNFSREIVTSPVNHGDNALKLTATSTGGGVTQVVYGLAPGSSVTCTVMAKVESGTARLQVYDGAGYTNGVSDTSTSTSWTELSVSKTVPSSGVVNFVLELVGMGDIAYFDYAFLDYTQGRGTSPTTDKIYFMNGRAECPLTHVFHYDDSLTTYSSNLVGTSKPYAILPATVQVNDLVIFGAQAATSLDGGAPFTNIVMNVTTTADITVEWKYINSSGVQTDLTAIDNTESFSVSGENIVQLTRPGDWTWYLLNGEYAWWIVAKVTAVNDTTPPQVGIHDPFTVSENHIEIPSSSLSGDNPPPVDLRILNEGANAATRIYEFVESGGNDGWWDDAAGPPGDLTDAEENLGQDSYILARYPSVNIPQGAKIARAQLTAISGGGTSGPWLSEIYLEDIDDATALAAGDDEINDRSWLVDTVNWEIDNAWWNGIDNHQVDGPRIDNLVQQVVDRPGWVSGNAMCLMIKDSVVGATDYRTFKMYESETYAWMLKIDYIGDELYSTKIVMGSRATSRGSDFRSVINLARYQRDAISVETVESNGCVWKRTNTDGGPHMSMFYPKINLTSSESTAEGNDYLDRVVITIPTDIASSYSGTFRAFLRSYNETEPTIESTPMFRLNIAISGAAFRTQSATLNGLDVPELLDLGTITIPDYAVSPDNLDMVNISFTIQMKSGGATDLSFLDLILIPTDEWSAEVSSPRSVRGAHSSDQTVIVKSIDTAGRLKSTMVDTGGKSTIWGASGIRFNPPLDETTRIYFITATDQTIGPSGDFGSEVSERASWSNMVYSLQAEYIISYLLYGGSL